MGAVFAAEHLQLQKQVALKVVHPGLAGNAAAAARFAREAMATSRIDHPNVISAMDYGTLADGTAYLAMQLVRGPSLAHLLQDGQPVHWVRMAHIGAQIADALVAAQPHAIVHRDLKPENVLLQPLQDGRDLVKVLDFGVAKFSRSSVAPPSVQQGQAMTGQGLVVGTAGYMSPEQCVGEEADVRSDLYSLGVILWEGVVGRRLWVAEDLQAIVQKQMSGPAPAVGMASGNADIPASFELLVAQLLAARREHRLNDPVEVRDKLRAFVNDSPRDEWRARTGTRPATTEAPARDLTGASQANVQPPPVRMSMGKRLGIAAVALLVIVAVGLAAGLLVGRTAPGKQTTSPNGLPMALEPAFVKMIGAPQRAVRVDAAEALLSHAPLSEVPRYVRAMADLQLARTCKQKRVHLTRIVDIDDPRALPLLRWLSSRPRGGCGHRARTDCLACLRRPLKKGITALEEAAARPSSTP